MSRARAFLFVAVICMAQFCAQAGIGQTLAIVHAIGPHYGIHNASDLTWVLAGYCLAMGSLILAAGRLGETYGRKRVLMIGFAWSAVWAAVSGAAFYSTYGFFVAARALQGLGIALSLPNGFALLEAAYQSSRRRALVLTLFATMAPAGLLVGAAGAGALALVWWPWAYWVFALALCIVAVVGRLVIPDLAQGGGTPRSIRAFVTELDVPGVVAGVLALALISFGWNQGPLVGWREPYVWVSLILGVLLLAVFVAVECYYAPKPLVPFMALSSDVALVLVSVACGWSCFGIWASYTWQFALDIRRASPLLTIAYFSPIILVSCLAAATTGPMIRRLGPFIVLLISLLGFTVGSLLVATAPAVQSYWAQLFLCILITSWSMVISLPAATFILSTAVDKTQQGTMASMITTAMYYSISLGLGIARNVEFGVNGGGLTRHHRLNGYRGGLYTGVCLAGIGTLVCLAFLMKVHRRNRKRSYNYHGSMEEHNQI
ncbi:major facilitator superfamily MFS-1 [Xylariaceae sp. FL0662B]|nr:major facilitator superfamily MFS-1 [Xylariaceae sp. FL0662B]